MKERKQCPDNKVLNAYFDGELRDTEVILHIKSCENCARQIEKIRKISELIRRAVVSEAAKEEDISDKVIDALRFSQKRSRIKYASYAEIFLRAAAIFAIFSAIIFYIYKLAEHRENFTKDVARTDIAQVKSHPNEVFPLNKNQSAKNFIHEKDSRMPMNTIEISTMKNVVSGPIDAKEVHQIFGAKEGDHAKYIASYVKHNWLEEKDGVSNSIMEIARKLNLNLKLINCEQSIEYFSVQLTKAELVVFVKALNSAGYKLLSPEEPQPESNKFYGAPTEQVEYNICLIKK